MCSCQLSPICYQSFGWQGSYGVAHKPKQWEKSHCSTNLCVRFCFRLVASWLVFIKKTYFSPLWQKYPQLGSKPQRSNPKAQVWTPDEPAEWRPVSEVTDCLICLFVNIEVKQFSLFLILQHLSFLTAAHIHTLAAVHCTHFYMETMQQVANVSNFTANVQIFICSFYPLISYSHLVSLSVLYISQLIHFIHFFSTLSVPSSVLALLTMAYSG